MALRCCVGFCTHVAQHVNQLYVYNIFPLSEFPPNLGYHTEFPALYRRLPSVTYFIHGVYIRESSWQGYFTAKNKLGNQSDASMGKSLIASDRCSAGKCFVQNSREGFSGPFVEKGDNTLLVHMCFNSLQNFFIAPLSLRAWINTLNRIILFACFHPLPHLLG